MARPHHHQASLQGQFTTPAFMKSYALEQTIWLSVILDLLGEYAKWVDPVTEGGWLMDRRASDVRCALGYADSYGLPSSAA
jgi:hypothetical protein